MSQVIHYMKYINV